MNQCTRSSHLATSGLVDSFQTKTNPSSCDLLWWRHTRGRCTCDQWL